MALIDTIVAFIVSLLVGGFGIYIGARVVVDTDDYSYAFITALIGAIVWAVVAFFLGWIPFLGPLLALIAYVAIINWRYPGDWLAAIGISLIAWIASIIVLYVVAALFGINLEAAGVPGV
jgi:hypothetical protein